MRVSYLHEEVILAFHLYGLFSDQEFSPLTINQIMRSSFVELFLPQVAVINCWSGNSPGHVRAAADCNTWHTW